jgi:hypothetical protein
MTPVAGIAAYPFGIAVAPNRRKQRKRIRNLGKGKSR